MFIHSYPPPKSAHSSSTQPPGKPLISWLTHVAGAVLHRLLTESETSLKIVQAEGQSGELLWEVYEPTAGQILYRRLRMR